MSVLRKTSGYLNIEPIRELVYRPILIGLLRGQLVCS
jgi:hypothetical protein